MSTTSKAAAGRPSRARYITIGCLAGIANGLFGAGGGMVVVPLLTRWTGMESRRRLPRHWPLSCLCRSSLLSPMPCAAVWILRLPGPTASAVP